MMGGAECVNERSRSVGLTPEVEATIADETATDDEKLDDDSLSDAA